MFKAHRTHSWGVTKLKKVHRDYSTYSRPIRHTSGVSGSNRDNCVAKETCTIDQKSNTAGQVQNIGHSSAGEPVYFVQSKEERRKYWSSLAKVYYNWCRNLNYPLFWSADHICRPVEFCLKPKPWYFSVSLSSGSIVWMLFGPRLYPLSGASFRRSYYLFFSA